MNLPGSRRGRLIERISCSTIIGPEDWYFSRNAVIRPCCSPVDRTTNRLPPVSSMICGAGPALGLSFSNSRVTSGVTLRASAPSRSTNRIVRSGASGSTSSDCTTCATTSCCSTLAVTITRLFTRSSIRRGLG